MTKSWPFFFFSIFLCFQVGGSSTPTESKPKTLVIIGDSLTEGYGVAKEKAFPALLEKKLGTGWKVVAAGISGSTSASAPGRVKWQLKSKPDLMILALGANDALRGLNPEDTEKNLAESIQLAQAEKVKVILAGMMAPPNYGKEYTEKFSSVYSRLEDKLKVPRLGFLLEGVAGESAHNLPDGIHPNEKGHQIIADKLALFLKAHL